MNNAPEYFPSSCSSRTWVGITAVGLCKAVVLRLGPGGFAGGHGVMARNGGRRPAPSPPASTRGCLKSAESAAGDDAIVGRARGARAHLHLARREPGADGAALELQGVAVGASRRPFITVSGRRRKVAGGLQV